MVFISYSSKDTEAANAVRMVLQNNGFDCWMAPNQLQWAMTIPMPFLKQLKCAICFCSSCLQTHKVQNGFRKNWTVLFHTTSQLSLFKLIAKHLQHHSILCFQTYKETKRFMIWKHLRDFRPR